MNQKRDNPVQDDQINRVSASSQLFWTPPWKVFSPWSPCLGNGWDEFMEKCVQRGGSPQRSVQMGDMNAAGAWGHRGDPAEKQSPGIITWLGDTGTTSHCPLAWSWGWARISSWTRDHRCHLCLSSFPRATHPYWWDWGQLSFHQHPLKPLHGTLKPWL